MGHQTETILAVVFGLFSISWVGCHLRDNGFMDREFEIKQKDDNWKKELMKSLEKYGRRHFQDRGHLEEEARKVLFLMESEDISNSDAAFYFHRLHDFNTDGFLDGLELLHATKHSMVHENETTRTDRLEDLAEIVDNELDLLDVDNNGLVDYRELFTYMNGGDAEPGAVVPEDPEFSEGL